MMTNKGQSSLKNFECRNNRITQETWEQFHFIHKSTRKNKCTADWKTYFFIRDSIKLNYYFKSNGKHAHNIKVLSLVKLDIIRGLKIIVNKSFENRKIYIFQQWIKKFYISYTCKMFLESTKLVLFLSWSALSKNLYIHTIRLFVILIK